MACHRISPTDTLSTRDNKGGPTRRKNRAQPGWAARPRPAPTAPATIEQTNEMATAVIIDAVRTANGQRNGGLSGWHPAGLAAEVLRALEARNGLDAALVEDVIMGCVTQIGAQSGNVARQAVLAAGWPDSVPGTTVDRQGGSGQQALHFAAQGVLAGAYDVVVAAGVEIMSLVPPGAAISHALGSPFGPEVERRFADRGGMMPLGHAAELLASQWGQSRAELDAWALRSHQRAAAATAAGHFDTELVEVRVHRAQRGGRAGPATLRADEGIGDADSASLAAHQPTFTAGGVITAGNSAHVADGASAALIMSEEKARELRLTPRARFVSFAVAAVDPILALTGPVAATRLVLARAQLRIEDIDLFEINEAFAGVALAWQSQFAADAAKLNVNGGAIALGDPLGSGGTRLLATLLGALEHGGGRYGLQSMSAAGGLATALIIERF